VLGARAAFIGGCAGTSNVAAGMKYGIPVRGTHAHSWIQAFPSELEAFRAYVRSFPDSALLLVDTYNVLESGVPNAIRVARELDQAGHRLTGVRLDSGDLAYLSRRARAMLDAAGFKDAVVMASGDLDEYLIRDIKNQGAAIGAWGVGTRLITAYDDPALGGVYKLAATAVDGEFKPEIKISENPSKVTNPGVKEVARLYNGENGRAVADLILLAGEELDPSRPLTIFDPEHTWKRKTLYPFTYKKLLTPVLRDGVPVYAFPPLEAIRRHAASDLATFSPEHRRLVNPHRYFVDLSLPLWELKQALLRQGRANGG
jgi:nicotinate phosphoribosyltransferase